MERWTEVLSTCSLLLCADKYDKKISGWKLPFFPLSGASVESETGLVDPEPSLHARARVSPVNTF